MSSFLSISRKSAPAGPTAATARGRRDGIGRPTSKAAERVSDDLRRGTGSALRARRRQMAWMLGASGAMGVVTAYQSGRLRRLPDPPLPGVDSNKVDASGELLATAKLAYDAVGATYVTVEQVSKHRALCVWCLAAAVASTAALPEARAAWRALRS